MKKTFETQIVEVLSILYNAIASGDAGSDAMHRCGHIIESMQQDLAASPESVNCLREETNTSMVVCRELLSNYRYSPAKSKQMILEVLKEIKDRGSADDWSSKELNSLPSWKSNIIKGARRR